MATRVTTRPASEEDATAQMRQAMRDAEESTHPQDRQPE
jgi:hypothetical protein